VQEGPCCAAELGGVWGALFRGREEAGLGCKSGEGIAGATAGEWISIR
jgi:hypothetical protein